MIVTNTNNLCKYKLDSLRPITKITYVDSPYGVNSVGYAVEYYNDSNKEQEYDFPASGVAFSGKDHVLSYDWGFGVPPGINNQYFKAKCYGYFYAEYTGSYTFAVTTDPSNKTRFYMDGDTPDNIAASGIFNEDGYLRINTWTDVPDAGDMAWGPDNIETRYRKINLVAGNWYSWGLAFANSDDGANLALRYVEPPSVTGIDGYPSDHDPWYRLGDFVPEVGAAVWGWIDSDEPVHHVEKVFHPKVMSAGITNFRHDWDDDSDADFETPIVIDSVLEVDGSHDLDKSSVFSFSVPFIEYDATTTGDGFYLDPNNGQFYEKSSGTWLRYGRKVSIYLGYQTKCNYVNSEEDGCDQGNPNITQFFGHECVSGGNIKCPANIPLPADYVQVFDGIITSIDIERGLSENTLKISCQDQMRHMLNAINENYPNNISYGQFNFTNRNTKNEPNGLTRPTTYDAWPLSCAIRDLCIKSGIDPQLLYKRRLLLNSAGEQEYGEYLIDDYGITLGRKAKYGNPSVTDESSSDDEYTWSFGFGETLHSIQTKMIDNYGFVFRMTPGGYVECSPINGPKIHVSDAPDVDEPFVSSTWSTSHPASPEWGLKVDSRADAGRYFECPTPGDKLIKTMKGSRFAVNYVRSSSTSLNWSSIENNMVGDGDPNFPGFKFIDYFYNKDAFSGNIYSVFNDYMYFFEMTQDIVARNLNLHLDELGTVFSNDTMNPYITIGWKLYSVPGGQSYVDGTAYETVFGAGAMSEVVAGTYIPPSGPHASIPNRIIQLALSDIELSNGTLYALKFYHIQDPSTPITSPPWPAQGYFYHKSPIRALTQQPCSKRTMIVCTTVHERAGGDTITYISNEDLGQNGSLVFTDISFDIILDWEERYSDCKVSVYVGDEQDPLAVITANNIYDGAFIHDDDLRFPQDGVDYSGMNPCQIEVPASLLQTGYADTLRAYDTYRFEIEHDGNVGEIPTRITSIWAYERDNRVSVYNFNTFDNIQKLDVKTSMDDIRNDVVVVGLKKGEIEDIDGEIINRNNPTMDYVYSRATDVGSIYKLNTDNSLGRKSPFVIYESTIVDQRHADWLAMAVLNKYRKFSKIPQWGAIGVPILEPNDSVEILDGRLDSMENNHHQWIVSCKHSYKLGDYETGLDSTPFVPWDSYIPDVIPNIKDFENNAFVNIKVANQAGEYVSVSNSFDVYGVEESGNRLKITYDQIIDGFVSARVYNVNYSHPVAYLVGGVKDGQEEPEYRKRGYSYELLWDCTDETNASRRRYPIPEDDVWKYIDSFKEETGLYSTPGEYYVEFSIVPVQNQGDQNTDEMFITSTKILPTKFNVAGSILSGNEGTDNHAQTWQIVWGDPISATIKIERPKAGGALLEYEECTYAHQVSDGKGTSFDVNQNHLGSKISFDFSNSLSRLVYFNINAQIMQGTAIQSPKFTDSPATYGIAKASWASFMAAGVLWDGTPFGINDDYLKAVADGNFFDKFNAILKALKYNKTYPGMQWNSIYGENMVNGDDDPYKYYHEDNEQQGKVYYDTLADLTISGDHEENESDFNFYDISTSFNDTDKTVTFWTTTCMPYKNWDIKDIVSPFTRKVTSESNINFYFNPNNIIQTDLDFGRIPIMEDKERDVFRQALATQIWLATMARKEIVGYGGSFDIIYADHKPKILLSAYTQFVARLWDKTGRYLDGGSQDIFAPLTHEHNTWERTDNQAINRFGGVGSDLINGHRVNRLDMMANYGFYASDFGMSSEHTHDEFNECVWLPSRRLTRKPNRDVDRYIVDRCEGEFESYFRWLETYSIDPYMYYVKLKKFRQAYMYTDDNFTYPNWGIGYCNSDKHGAIPGSFMWHGYLKFGSEYASVSDSLPFDTTNMPFTDHWKVYGLDEDNHYTARLAGAVNSGKDYDYKTAGYDIRRFTVSQLLHGISDGRIFFEDGWRDLRDGYSVLFSTLLDNMGSVASELSSAIVDSGLTADNFHVHLPKHETCLYQHDWEGYLTSMDYPDSEDFQWNIVASFAADLPCAFSALHWVGTHHQYWGLVTDQPADPYDLYTNKAGGRMIYPVEHKPYYNNDAWYVSSTLAIPDWEVPSDLSDWSNSRIPLVDSFGKEWGL